MSEPILTDAFRAHDHQTAAIVEALREARCRQTDRFTEHLSETVEVLRPLAAPWNLELLFRLSMEGAQRFSELKRALPTISSRVLTDKLRHLEAHYFVERRETEGYALTARGEVVARHLHPLVFALRNAEAMDLVARATSARTI